MLLQVLRLFSKDCYSPCLERTFHTVGFFGWLLKVSHVLSFQQAARRFLSPRASLSLLCSPEMWPLPGLPLLISRRVPHHPPAVISCFSRCLDAHCLPEPFGSPGSAPALSRSSLLFPKSQFSSSSSSPRARRYPGPGRWSRGGGAKRAGGAAASEDPKRNHGASSDGNFRGLFCAREPAPLLLPPPGGRRRGGQGCGRAPSSAGRGEKARPQPPPLPGQLLRAAG